MAAHGRVGCRCREGGRGGSARAARRAGRQAGGRPSRSPLTHLRAQGDASSAARRGHEVAVVGAPRGGQQRRERVGGGHDVRRRPGPVSTTAGSASARSSRRVTGQVARPGEVGEEAAVGGAGALERRAVDAPAEPGLDARRRPALAQGRLELGALGGERSRSPRGRTRTAAGRRARRRGRARGGAWRGRARRARRSRRRRRRPGRRRAPRSSAAASSACSSTVVPR